MLIIAGVLIGMLGWFFLRLVVLGTRNDLLLQALWKSGRSRSPFQTKKCRIQRVYTLKRKAQKLIPGDFIFEE